VLKRKASEMFQAIILSTEIYVFKSTDAQSQVKHTGMAAIISNMESYWRFHFT